MNRKVRSAFIRKTTRIRIGLSGYAHPVFASNPEPQDHLTQR